MSCRSVQVISLVGFKTSNPDFGPLERKTRAQATAVCGFYSSPVQRKSADERQWMI